MGTTLRALDVPGSALRVVPTGLDLLVGLRSGSWRALTRFATPAEAPAPARALAPRLSPASELPLCVPNLPPLPPRARCGWCEQPSARAAVSGWGVERPLASKEESSGAGPAAAPTFGPPALRLLPGSEPYYAGLLYPNLSLLSPSTWSWVFPEPREYAGKTEGYS